MRKKWANFAQCRGGEHKITIIHQCHADVNRLGNELWYELVIITINHNLTTFQPLRLNTNMKSVALFATCHWTHQRCNQSWVQSNHRRWTMEQKHAYMYVAQEINGPLINQGQWFHLHHFQTTSVLAQNIMSLHIYASLDKGFSWMTSYNNNDMFDGSFCSRSLYGMYVWEGFNGSRLGLCGLPLLKQLVQPGRSNNLLAALTNHTHTHLATS